MKEKWKRWELQEQGTDGKWYRATSKRFEIDSDGTKEKAELLDQYRKQLLRRFDSDLLPVELKPERGKLRLCLATIEVVEENIIL